jgi:nucleoside phosphorylase
LERYRVGILAVLGIAAGIHRDVSACDVVVPEQVDAYIESSKAVGGGLAGGFVFELGGPSFRTTPELVQAVINFEFTQAESFHRWQQAGGSDLVAFVPEDTLAHMQASHLIQPSPRIHSGILASGPVVGSAGAFTTWLLAHNRNYRALEMETAGAMEVASLSSSPKTLVLRGVSDFGDERKSALDAVQQGVLRRIATRNALRLLWALVDAGALD